MNIIFLLAPFSVALGLLAVGAFFWTLRSGQYEDIQGAAARILIDELDPDAPSETEDSPETPTQLAQSNPAGQAGADTWRCGQSNDVLSPPADTALPTVSAAPR